MNEVLSNMDCDAPESEIDHPQQTPDSSVDIDTSETNSQTPQLPDSPEKLQEAKRTFQNYDASGNTAELQFFVNTLNMGSVPQYKENPDTSKARRDVSFDLRVPESCAKFVEEYRNGEYLALAVTLAVFDVVTVNDLPSIEGDLIQFLPDVDNANDESKAINDHHSNPYLSLQSKLRVIGAKSFIRNDGQNCVGFGKESKQILFNLWTQFPALRVPIISWLVEVNRIHKYRTSFDVQQMIGAFSRIISLDFKDAIKKIFPKLYSDSKNMFFLGTLACFLVKDPAMRNAAYDLLLNWAKSDSRWLWKSALLSFAGLDASEKYINLKILLEEKLREIIYFCDNKDAFLLIKILSCSIHVRQMLCEVLFMQMTSKDIQKREKQRTAQFYLLLIMNGYYSVNELSQELFFVACDTPVQQKALSPVITQVLAVRPARRLLFTVLGQYIAEIDSYNASNKLIKHLTAYFINLIESAPLYREDVLAILKKYPCSVSTSILEILCGRTLNA